MNIYKKLIKIFFTTCFLLAASQVSAIPHANPLYQKIQTAIDSFRIKYKIPGIQVSMSMPSEFSTIDFVSGTTTLNGSNKITAGNLFQFGSNTKSFTAALILQLEEEKKLNINDPIGKYLPQYPKWRKITIKQLLSMTSGIFDYLNDSTFIITVISNPTKIWRPEELISFAYQHPEDFVPGTNWHYSNTNFILLGMIIEKVTKHLYSYEIAQRFLGTANLNLLNSYFYLVYPDDIMRQMSHGYNGYVGDIKDVTSSNASWGWSAGGIVINTRDSMRWIRLLLDSNKVLDKLRLAEMTSLVCSEYSAYPCKYGEPVSPSIGGYGLGVAETPAAQFGTIWNHGGTTPGYRTVYLWIPKYSFAIALAFNLMNNDTYQYIRVLAMQIATILYGSKEWQEYREIHGIPYIALESNQDEIKKAFARLFIPASM